MTLTTAVVFTDARPYQTRGGCPAQCHIDDNCTGIPMTERQHQTAIIALRNHRNPAHFHYSKKDHAPANSSTYVLVASTQIPHHKLAAIVLQTLRGKT